MSRISVNNQSWSRQVNPRVAVIDDSITPWHKPLTQPYCHHISYIYEPKVQFPPHNRWYQELFIETCKNRYFIMIMMNLRHQIVENDWYHTFVVMQKTVKSFFALWITNRFRYTNSVLFSYSREFLRVPTILSRTEKYFIISSKR